MLDRLHGEDHLQVSGEESRRNRLEEFFFLFGRVPLRDPSLAMAVRAGRWIGTVQRERIADRLQPTGPAPPADYRGETGPGRKDQMPTHIDIDPDAGRTRSRRPLPVYPYVDIELLGVPESTPASPAPVIGFHEHRMQPIYIGLPNSMVVVSYDFLEGLAVGTIAWLCVDLIILSLLLPLRPYIRLMARPVVLLKLRALLGMTLTDAEKEAVISFDRGQE